MKQYVSILNKTITDLETFETVSYNSFEEIMEVSLKTSRTIYVYDLDKLGNAIANYCFNNDYKYAPTADKNSIISAIDPKTFQVVSSHGSTTIVRVRIRRNTKAQLEILDAKKLFGKSTIEEIIEAVGCDEEEEGMALALSDLFDRGYQGWTLSGNAFKDLKKRCFKGKNEDYCELNFLNVFPKLSEEVHDYVMSSFQGGICHINRDIKGKELSLNGLTIDKTSMYPSIMEKEFLPFGAPVHFEGEYVYDRKMPLYFCQVKIERLTLKEDGVACVRKRSEEGYYVDGRNLTLVLNNIDLDMVYDNYKVEGLEYIDGYKFKAKKAMFKEFIDYWKNEKEKATESGDAFGRMIAKLMLNSAYGKFASKTDKKPCYYRQLRSGKFAKTYYSKAQGKTEGNSVYAPVGCFITSYGRKELIKVIKDNKDIFAYADTDSAHLMTDKIEDINTSSFVLDDVKFGAWKIENTWTKARFLGKKQYVQETDKGLKVVCAGMPRQVMETIKDFNTFSFGKKFDFDIKSFDVEANLIMTRTSYELKDELIK